MDEQKYTVDRVYYLARARSSRMALKTSSHQAPLVMCWMSERPEPYCPQTLVQANLEFCITLYLKSKLGQIFAEDRRMSHHECATIIRVHDPLMAVSRC